MSSIQRNAYTAVIARGDWWEGEIQSEPYEAAWAAEAVFFVRVMQIRGTAAPGALALARIQISPDGMHWVDEGGEMRIPGNDAALAFSRAANFGGWLRLAVTVPAGLGLQVVATLALKG